MLEPRIIVNNALSPTADARTTAGSRDELHARAGDVAIVGSSCRFPGAGNPEQLWKLLHDGVDMVRDFPANRWDMDAYWDPQPAPGKTYARHAATLEDIRGFDAPFFSISAPEATDMDPQHRLLLELVWEALERASIDPLSLAATRTGVFIGISNVEYSLRHIYSGDAGRIGPFSGMGTALCTSAGRISYVLGLRGPSLAVDTACSSSLVAIHLACESLRTGQCDIAIAGGASLMLAPEGFIYLSQIRALSPDGLCKAFDESANGYGRGEGGAALVLKRLEDADRAGDRCEAVILGSAINHDGATNGFTAPSGAAQRAVIGQALASAGVRASDVGYVEAHGTGTQIGDVIEAGALASIYNCTERRGPLWIGSIKSNIGHLEAAAGIAGLMKVVAALGHHSIPTHLHVKTPSKGIDWDAGCLRVATERQPWPNGRGRNVAGLSAFGLSGTNVHMIVTEPGTRPRPATSHQRSRILVPLSAGSEEALREQAMQLARYMREHPQVPIAEVAAGEARRARLKRRAAWVTDNASSLEKDLDAFGSGRLSPSAIYGTAKIQPKIAFLFSGQGSQYEGMGEQLYGTEDSFRFAIDACEEAFATHLDQPLKKVLFYSPASTLARTIYLQPALFSLQYALGCLWRSWGIEPAVVLGHSIGEFAAVCVAGAVDLDDVARLVAFRGRLMETECPPGAMAAIAASQDRVSPVLATCQGVLSIAAINTPQSTVISGEAPAVSAACDQLAAMGIRTRPLLVDRAFHSPLMESIKEEFMQVAESIRFRATKVKIVSGRTGRIVRPEDLASAAYWWMQLREPVRFLEALREIDGLGVAGLIEIGPKATLIGFHRETFPGSLAARVPSISGREMEATRMLQSAGELFVGGAMLDFTPLHGSAALPDDTLPTYPFQRKTFWRESPPYRAGGEDKSMGILPCPIQATDEFPLLRGSTPEHITAYLRGVIGALLSVPEETVNPECPITELGVDSLLLVLGAQRVQHDLKIQIQVHEMLEPDQTLSSLAKSLATMASKPPAAHDGLVDLAHTARSQGAAKRHLVVRPHPLSIPAMRLFCLPPAGAGLDVFQPWAARFTGSIELCLPQLPGRDHRDAEASPRDAEALVADLASQLWPYLDRPFAIYGHSMGASLGFRLTQQLEAKGMGPAVLFLSAERAPQYAEPLDEELCELEDENFLLALTSMGLLQAGQGGNQRVRAMMPRLRTDLLLCSTLQRNRDLQLACPVVAFAGKRDAFAPPHKVAGWWEHTADAFSLHTVPGDHAFLLSDAEALIATVIREMDSAFERANRPAQQS